MAWILGVALGPLEAPAPIVQHTMYDGEPPAPLHVEYGADPMFDSVGSVWVDSDDGWTGASGVLIDSSWVLLTAHQLNHTGITEIRFYTGSYLDFNDPTEMILADQHYMHPEYDGEIFGAWDVGLLHLSQPSIMTPAVRFRGQDVQGTVVQWAGYGYYGEGLQGELGADNYRRGWENLFEWFGGEGEAYYADPMLWAAELNWPGTGALPMEGISCNGNSGSGGFALIDGSWQLVMIDKSGSGDTYGDESLGTRVSLINDWVDSIIGPALCDGDANSDGAVDPLDSGFVLARLGCAVGEGDPECDASDQNGDGAVDPLDAGFVLARLGECSSMNFGDGSGGDKQPRPELYLGPGPDQPDPEFPKNVRPQ